jgi:glycosyltransferase involved in cell wall biosynthesis
MAEQREKKRILVLNYEFPPLGGGQANANKYMMEEFAHYPDYAFTVVTSSVDGYRVEQFADNITIHYLDIGKKGKDLHRQSITNLLTYGRLAYRLAKRLIQEESYTMSMCRSYPAIMIGYALQRFHGIPYISLLRGANVPFYEKKWLWLDRLIFQFLAPYLWKKSAHVIANSQQLKDLALQTAPHQPIDIITNGVNLAEYDLPAAQNPELFEVLFVGRLTPRKGVHELLDAFVAFAAGKDDVHLHLVGDGEMLAEGKALVAEHHLTTKVTFHGLQSHERLPHFYKKADIYILPSKNEGMSNTLLEAMASGLPVIISNV